MHKHRRSGQRDKSKAFKNANRRVSSACRSLVKSLGERVPAGTFGSDYLRAEYLSKFNGEGSATPRERRQAAIEKWRSVDRLNADTNRRLRGLSRGYNLLPRITFDAFLRVAQHHIASVLGQLTESVVFGTFTGGASTSRSRASSQPAEKFCGEADATQDIGIYIDLVRRLVPLYRQHGFLDYVRDVPGAELFTVPKKAEIDRCACKEPDINMFLQKGVGRHIRRNLRRRAGINLNDQSINRELAYRGSVDGSLATIDLSSASDTVTRSCVLALLPYDWYLYLNDLRSSYVNVEGSFSEVEMFSSMGNGFTFELESLIFWGLAKATAYLRGHPGIISVYGDDIIVPTGMYDDFTWVLSEFGFSVNPSKSFATGPFRESCGGHFYLGNDVTPFYLKREPTRLTDVIRVANQLRRWAMADPFRVYEVPGLYSLWVELRNFVPQDLWGGCDMSVDTQLVSPDIPKNRLVRVSKDKELPDVGRYLHWHTTVWNRSQGPDEEGPLPVEDTKSCRRRTAKPGVLASDAMFPEELGVTAIRHE